MAGEKKNNMATRFCDKVVENIQVKIDLYNDKAKRLRAEAKDLASQAEVLELQIKHTNEILEAGNYENGSSKDA